MFLIFIECSAVLFFVCSGLSFDGWLVRVLILFSCRSTKFPEELIGAFSGFQEEVMEPRNSLLNFCTCVYSRALDDEVFFLLLYYSACVLRH